LENKFHTLVNKVLEIKSKYKEKAKITGEGFNLFSILLKENNEVATHSRFIAELLNPNGSHLQGTIFLDSFLNHCKTKIELQNKENVIVIQDFKDKSAFSEVKVEFHIGKITEGDEEQNYENAKGGRIDILLRKNRTALILENKIYASEQPYQMIRYANYGDEKHPNNYQLIYLTLYGDKPTSCREKDKEKILCLSYKEDVVSWLESCKNSVENIPIIREGITQYLNLIKKLTNQTINKQMENEIIELIINNENNFESAQEISNNFEKAKRKLIEKQLKQLEDILINKGIPVDENARQRSGKKEALFVSLKKYGEFDLGVQIELDYAYYFFCMAEKDKPRDQTFNEDERFDEVWKDLGNIIENTERNAYAIAISTSNDFIIKFENKNGKKYYYPNEDNSNVYLKLAEDIAGYKNSLDSIQ